MRPVFEILPMARLETVVKDVHMKSAVRENAEIKYAVSHCSLGAILVAASEKGVCAILLGDQPAPLVQNLQERFPASSLVAADGGLDRLVAKVIKFVEAPRVGLDVPLHTRG